MTIEKWDRMTKRQRLIIVSRYAYYFALMGVAYHKYVSLEEF